MMAHELPLQVRPQNPPTSKTNKHKPVAQPLRQLPNGEKPNFGPLLKEKLHKQQLPNGDKPNFGHESKGTKNQKKKKQNASQKGGADAAAAAAATTTNSKAANNSRAANKPKKGEESYAGSSFHSSPEALALPKPSFRTSPKPTAVPVQTQSPVLAAAINTKQNVHPAMFYQGMPPAAPPRYPVTAYPPNGPGVPGFNYHASPQGFINYLYPPTAVPQPPIPMQSYPLGPPVAHYGHHQPLPPQQHQPTAHKITFNELMGSK